MMNEMMAQTLTIGTAHKARAARLAGGRQDRHIQDFRDAWFIGYTAHLVTGVWLGNDDGTPTKHVTGGSLPVEIWSRFMRGAHQGVPVASLPGAPSGGLFSGLFGGGSRTRERPMPPAPRATGRGERARDQRQRRPRRLAAQQSVRPALI